MKTIKTVSLLGAALFLLAACHPRIYEFKVNPATIGPNDTVRMSWKATGAATLTISDVNYPGTGSNKLADVTLLVLHHSATMAYTLHANSTLRIPIAPHDSLSISKKPDHVSDDRLRYVTLIATRNRQDSSRVVQVAVRPDLASDAIAFRPVVIGDRLVASGVNNPARWGNQVTVISVADSTSQPLYVAHSGIGHEVAAGGRPDQSFRGTTVMGNWSFSRLMTPAEKNNPATIPRFLSLFITIKLR